MQRQIILGDFNIPALFDNLWFDANKQFIPSCKVFVNL